MTKPARFTLNGKPLPTSNMGGLAINKLRRILRELKYGDLLDNLGLQQESAIAATTVRGLSTVLMKDGLALRRGRTWYYGNQKTISALSQQPE
jgi:hypothetical protein